MLKQVVNTKGWLHLHRQWIWRLLHLQVRWKRKLPDLLRRDGTEDGKCNCCHGLAVDLRYDQPLLLYATGKPPALPFSTLTESSCAISYLFASSFPGEFLARLCRGFRAGGARHNSREKLMFRLPSWGTIRRGISGQTMT